MLSDTSDDDRKWGGKRRECGDCGKTKPASHGYYSHTWAMWVCALCAERRVMADKILVALDSDAMSEDRDG